MPRNISFSLTTEQFKNRTKTVTRRKGWKFLKAGDILMGCEKCQGIKRGELNRLGLIRVVSVRRERLNALCDGRPRQYSYGWDECKREGFPGMHPDNFVRMFCKHMGGEPSQEVTRIEFAYIEEADK